MAKLPAKKTNPVLAAMFKYKEPAIATATTLGVVGGGVYLASNAPSDSNDDGDHPHLNPSDINIYTDTNGHMYTNGPDGASEYQLSHSNDTLSAIYGVLDNETQAKIGAPDAHNWNYSAELTDGKDALITFTPIGNVSGNDTARLPISKKISGPDFEKVIKADLQAVYGQPIADINYIPASALDPVHNEEIVDQWGKAYSDRVVQALNYSMEQLYPMPEVNATTNETSANDTKMAEIEAGRADYLKLIDDAKNGNFSEMQLVTRLNDKGEKETRAALKYENGNFSKGVQLMPYATHDVLADGKLGDSDAKAELDSFFAVKEVQQQPTYTAEYLSHIGDLDTLKTTLANWENDTGREATVFSREEKIQELVDFGTEQGVDMSYLTEKMNETGAKKFTVYDTFDTKETGAYVVWEGEIQVGEDANGPIKQEAIVWDQPISPEMAKVIEQYMRGY